MDYGHGCYMFDAKKLISMVGDVKLIKFQKQKDDKIIASNIDIKSLNFSCVCTNINDHVSRILLIM